jgi:alkanesulfonate monooxygenase SsuD/methylene tetrahydromethanopterin reductase-like flavin-dependent oxidoreductase (luciferase family)
MQVGVGLPNIIPGTPGRAVIDWGREAERLGFASVATLGRLTFPTVEELIALAAVAAVK